MRIMIDIGHPAHVHLFKNFAKTMMDRGHQVLFTVREKEFEIALLKHEGFYYKSLGKHYRSKIGKVWGLMKFTLLTIMASCRFKPDMYMSHGSMYAALASFFFRKPNISLEDTGNWEQVRIYLPFTEAILTSSSFPFNYGKKQIWYEGYHELAYLHPNYYKPDRSIFNELGVNEGERYFILRFVSWDASHDLGQKGIDLELKRGLIGLLKKHGKIFISSEKEIDEEFVEYLFRLPPEKMHDALAFADLFVGEGATMASECAVLGTPAVYVNSLQRGYTSEQEKKYGLVYNFINANGVLEKVRELLDDDEMKQKSITAQKKLLSEKIDVTAFLAWLAENWPKSFRMMKADPDYQYKFR